MSNDKVMELLTKLKQLSENGVGGEKENAQSALKRLAEKHQINLEDLETEDIESFFFDVNKDQQSFFVQVVSSIMGSKFDVFRRNSKKVYLLCTSIQAIEISSKFDFFWNEYQRDLKVFYAAFIQKNHLYVNRDDKEFVNSRKEYTDEERKHLLEVLEMTSVLKSKHYQRRID